MKFCKFSFKSKQMKMKKHILTFIATFVATGVLGSILGVLYYGPEQAKLNNFSDSK